MQDEIEETVAAFRATLEEGAPPEGVTPCVAAIWHLERGDWGAAHALVQDEEGADAAWVHAHIHRVEGDLGNADYWYARAGKPPHEGSFDEERSEILAVLLTG